MSNKLTGQQRQAALKKRRTEAGFRQLGEWVHEDDRETLKQFAKCLRVERFKKMNNPEGILE